MYLSNVETLARKFVEEKREALLSLRNDGSSFLAFWASMEPRKRRQMATASGEVILKVGGLPAALGLGKQSSTHMPVEGFYGHLWGSQWLSALLVLAVNIGREVAYQDGRRHQLLTHQAGVESWHMDKIYDGHAQTRGMLCRAW